MSAHCMISSEELIMAFIVGYFLPPIDNVKISFYRAILKGEK